MAKLIKIISFSTKNGSQNNDVCREYIKFYTIQST